MLSLRQELVFYGAYHHNKWNQLIHFVFVPTILFSVLVWLAYSGPYADSTQLKSYLPEWVAKYALDDAATSHARDRNTLCDRSGKSHASHDCAVWRH